MSKRHKTQAAPSSSDFGSVIVNPETGEFRYAVPVEVDDVAVGIRATVKRGRRREAWEGVKGLTPGMHQAALAYRQAWEHLSAGRGMGPMPWGADRVGGTAAGVVLLAQERGLSAADVHTRGARAMGLVASQGVVQWVVIEGRALGAFDARQRWRKGMGAAQLVEALELVAGAYGCE